MIRRCILCQRKAACVGGYCEDKTACDAEMAACEALRQALWAMAAKYGHLTRGGPVRLTPGQGAVDSFEDPYAVGEDGRAVLHGRVLPKPAAD